MLRAGHSQGISLLNGPEGDDCDIQPRPMPEINDADAEMCEFSPDGSMLAVVFKEAVQVHSLNEYESFIHTILLLTLVS